MSSKTSRFSLNGDGKHPDQSQFNPRKKQVVEALSTRYKELNKLWENAEADLKEIPIPVDVPHLYKSVDADPERPGEHQIHSYIGIVRSTGGWRICSGGTHDAFHECDYNWTPITECPVDIRLEAVPHLGELHDRVLKAAEDCVPTLDRAIADLRNTLQNW